MFSSELVWEKKSKEIFKDLKSFRSLSLQDFTYCCGVTDSFSAFIRIGVPKSSVAQR